MKRVKPGEGLRNVPCAVVAVACAEGADKPTGAVQTKDGYVSLPVMNKFVRSRLIVKRQVKFKRGERPKLKDLHLDGKAVVCVLGHYLYLDGETYYSFFKNSGDDVVSYWEVA